MQDKEKEKMEERKYIAQWENETWDNPHWTHHSPGHPKATKHRQYLYSTIGTQRQTLKVGQAWMREDP